MYNFSWHFYHKIKNKKLNKMCHKASTTILIDRVLSRIIKTLLNTYNHGTYNNAYSHFLKRQINWGKVLCEVLRFVFFVVIFRIYFERFYTLLGCFCIATYSRSLGVGGGNHNAYLLISLIKQNPLGLNINRLNTCMKGTNNFTRGKSPNCSWIHNLNIKWPLKYSQQEQT